MWINEDRGTLLWNIRKITEKIINSLQEITYSGMARYCGRVKRTFGGMSELNGKLSQMAVIAKKK